MFGRFLTCRTLVVLALLACWSRPADAQLYFADDFDDPEASEGKWEVITGEWQIADGVYHQLATSSPWQVSMVAA